MTIKELCKTCYRRAKQKGFWSEKRNDGELIALIHSELSEGLEGLRHGNPKSDKIPEFTSIEEELADVVIRVCDMAGGKKLRLQKAIVAKLEYNKTRELKHGKKF